jgi:Fur family ferric uptake transcriptional regulator
MAERPNTRPALLPSGVRSTVPRRAVVEALARMPGRFTAVELHEQARAIHGRLGLATTYRTLDLLREAGAVRVLSGETGPAYIRCHPGHHHHLVCVSCGGVEETELCAAPAADEIRLRHGFEVEHHEIDLFGYCARCAA